MQKPVFQRDVSVIQDQSDDMLKVLNYLANIWNIILVRRAAFLGYLSDGLNIT